MGMGASETQPVDLSDMADRQLLALSAACVAELRERGVVRTGNAPLGDYAEWLAAKAFSGELAPNSERSFDLTTPAGVRIQVKSRRVSTPPNPGQLQTSPFRSWGFDQALLMLVDEKTYEIRRASLLPREVVEAMSRYVAHINGSNAYMTEDLMGHDEAIDVTGLLRAAAGDEPRPAEPAPRPQQRTQPLRAAAAPPALPPPPPPASAPRTRPDPDTTVDWIWMANGAIDEFRQWRIQGGATAASAQSYTSGAKAFVRFCRAEGLGVVDGLEPFPGHLTRKGELSSKSISDYCSHARKFVEFLRVRRVV